MENVGTPQVVTAWIPAQNLGGLNGRIEKLNRTAKKLGLQEIKTRVGGTKTVKIPKENGYEVTRRFYEVTLEGFSPVLPGGWTFQGTVEHTPAGNILRGVPGQEIPELYRNGAATCDHCAKSRRRKDTYVVKNEAGETKRVGKQCVRDYLGHASLEHISWIMSIIRELQSAGDGEEEYHGGGGAEACRPLDIMAFAAACIRRWGYVSSAAAQSYAEKSGGAAGLTRTSDRVWLNIFIPLAASQWTQAEREALLLQEGELTDQDWAFAQEALAWTKTLLKPGYETNLMIVCQKDLCVRRDVGLVTSAVGAYQKHLGTLVAHERRKSAMQEAAERSKHFGTVGERKIFNLAVEAAHVFPSDYAEDRTMYRMVDQDGNVAIWWSTSAKLETGKTYRIKGTVKEHSEYKGIKQTVLSRCVDEDVAQSIRAETLRLKAESKELTKKMQAERPEHDWESCPSSSYPNARCKKCSLYATEMNDRCAEPALEVA